MHYLLQHILTAFSASLLLFISKVLAITINQRFFKRADGTNNQRDGLALGFVLLSIALLMRFWVPLYGEGTAYDSTVTFIYGLTSGGLFILTYLASMVIFQRIKKTVK